MRKKLLRSRSGFEKPESREEAIMQNILGASNVLEPSESNIEEILKSILYNTPYTKEAEFEIEKILLAIKNNGTYDGECESRDMKILFAILKDLDYTKEAESRIEELFIEWLHQRSSIKVLEGVPPLTFTSRGLPLINYLIEGNTVQNGTPTPSNPVEVNGVGTLDSGQYIIPISSAGQTTPVYLGEVQSTRKINKYTFTGDEPVFSCVRTTDSQNYCVAYRFDQFGMTDIKDYAEIMANIDYPVFVSSHFKEKPNTNSTYNNIQANQVGANSVDTSQNRYIIFCVSGLTTAADYSAWFAQQYANGTPVEVYYILETATTGIVNEPLMKIGDYADTVSMEQAGVEIPTASGSNTLDVDTTVKPSNIYIEYK